MLENKVKKINKKILKCYQDIDKEIKSAFGCRKITWPKNKSAFEDFINQIQNRKNTI